MRHPVSYSVWLVLDEPDPFTEVIAGLGKDFGGPTFIPHITLLGGFLGDVEDLADRTKRLATKLSVFDIVLGQAKFGGEFFHSFVLPVVEGITDAHATAERFFDREEPSYRPHMSLFYGDILPEQHASFEAALPASLPKRIAFDRIYLAHNDEPNLRWRLVESFAIGAK